MTNQSSRLGGYTVLFVTLSALWIVAVSAFSPVGAQAQESTAFPASAALRVYLDCSGQDECRDDAYRQAITFVDWVRQPRDAQVHLLITSQDTGGGRLYTVEFMGRDDMASFTDRYEHAASSTDVEDEVVSALVRVASLGLVRFAIAAGASDRVVVSGRQEEAGNNQAPALPAADPWNFWVFELRGSIDMEREDLQEQTRYEFSVGANRTTDLWKLSVRLNGDFERESFELPSEGRTVRDDRDRWSASAYAVRSLGERVGVGTEVSADNSTRLNRKLQVGWGSGVEVNLFPYSESNRRSLLARYILSVETVEYQETTIFDVLEETSFVHEAGMSYDAREPWGDASISLGARQFLDRTSAWSVRIDGFIRYRLFRGFSVTVSGKYESLKDQIYLPRRTLSDEDILLGRRQLPTQSASRFRLGFSYSFGSIFNNTVNDRFRYGLR